MQELKDLLELVEKCRSNCPWCRQQTVESFTDQVMSEAKELEVEVKSNNIEGIKEELGDLIWDVLMLLHIGEHKGLFNSSEVLKGVNDKMKRRKPYILTGEKVSYEQAMRIWKETKLSEKQK